MATNNSRLPAPPASNGVITGPPKGVVGGNRKKQKRRAKQAAPAPPSRPLNLPPPSGPLPGVEYDEDPLGYRYGDGEDEEFDYSEAEQTYDHYLSSHTGSNGYSMPPPPTGNKKKKKKKSSVVPHDYNPELLGNHMPPLPNPPPHAAGYDLVHKAGGPSIWNTSSQQERQNIKDFWLSLSEEERKSLLKIEKEAVLRKMKQQQKHSCSCTVCGRKRTAIEEELEVLYEGYYEELEQYAHHDHPPLPSTDGLIPEPLESHRPHPLAAPPPPNPHHRTSQLQEHFDDEEFSGDEEDEEEYSDEEDAYSDDIEPIHRSGVPDFLTFGQNLTVKGILTPWLEKLYNCKALKLNPADNLLTVADDLLKNDGRKFIEMMEQLAERRMQRENDAEYAAANPSHPGAYPPGDPGYNHEDPLAANDEYDDEEASYDSQDDFDDDMDEEDEMGGLTEEQRMQEGRRMFQIFAARMFEQRVLTAYKEKVAAERQQRLLEELEDETKQEAQREAKKARDAQKKKDKKKQQQQAKAEEKARKEAEKTAEEARLREAEEKKQEEQRRKKEEQRKKKEDEKRKLEEERAKKEAEKLRRQQEEQQRREEAERKAREAKAAEKAKKDEARKREREDREAREKEARDRKAQDDKEREEKTKPEGGEVKGGEKAARQAAQPASTPQQPPPPQIQKRPSQPGMVAVPGVYPKQLTSGVSSPHPTIATPAIPKAPTPAKQRQTSQQGSLASSSPKQSISQISSVPSKSTSPSSFPPQQQHQQPHPTETMVQPKTVLQKPSTQQHPPSQPQQQHPMPLTSPTIQPPPGMPFPQQNHPPGFGAIPSMGYPGFQGPPGSMMHGNMGPRGSMPMWQHQQQAPPVNSRFGPLGMNNPPSGMMPPQGRGLGMPFDGSSNTQAPPGFMPQQQAPQQAHQRTPPAGQPASMAPGADAPRTIMTSHSRQQSTSDKERFESAANQPIGRPIPGSHPAPIQRPSSVKPQDRRGSNSDLDDLSRHLGSSALLDDSDEPIMPSLTENRRASNIAAPTRPNAMNTIGGSLGSSFGSTPLWNSSSLQTPFGQSPGLGQPSLFGLPQPGIGSWPSNNAAFGANNAFGTIGTGQMRSTGTGGSRPLTIRLAVCQACKQLSASSRGDNDGYHDVNTLLRQIEVNRTPLDPPPTLREIEEICETEGDSQNGGGELHVRKMRDMLEVMWTPNVATPETRSHYPGAPGDSGLAGLGGFGSPIPGKVSPSSGFGAPGMGRSGGGGGFQSLGAVGSPSSQQSH
ncbi:salt tolerance down-regulator-domain-containing protein [Neohortaea acidophila]|uniref:Stress response protein NST1 n=1 Tax=Neohortaea acidophila TaxID=245834 RepID=A0A6A6Q7F8_9PEZI|nr:salt tolerance down-regulator-domain-containing protein [Neohortaea acidophila]KAF2487583.1 salt tolerance down-regulator-domain-containing protein [Neohortaea acidophila]